MTVVVRSMLPVLSLAVVFAWAPAALGQSNQIDELARDVEALKQGQASILKELQELKSVLLGARQAAQAAQNPLVPKDTLLTVTTPVFKGEKNAPVTIVEFSDYQCPFCARHVKNTLPQLDKEYIATGKVKYVFRDNPIEAIHPQAPKAHEAARCAGEHGKYWPMHNVLFDKQKELSVNDLVSHAQGLGLDAGAFRKCVDSGKYAAAVRADQADGGKLGVRGTPTFIVGRTEPNGSGMKVTTSIVGAQPYARFKEAIDAALGVAAAPDAKR